MGEVEERTEWTAGRLLRTLERRQGERTDLTSSNDGQSPHREALDAAGLSRQDANRWQKLAAFGAVGGRERDVGPSGAVRPGAGRHS